MLVMRAPAMAMDSVTRKPITWPLRHKSLPSLPGGAIGRLHASSVRLHAFEPAGAGGSHDNMLSMDDDSDTGKAPKGKSERHVFTFRRWHIHRNSNERYMRHMKGMLTSVTWRNLTPPLTALTAFAVLNGVYQTLYENHMLPPEFPLLQLSDGPLELTSFALSLLLVFRTDSSYSRWTEALEVWSRVRNTSKDMIRDAVCWIRDPALLSAMVRWTLTYAYSLKVYLRENDNINTASARLLLKHEHHVFVNLCKDTSSAYPQYALHVLTQAVQRANVAPNREDKLMSAISTLNQCIGACEKLLRYPIPLSYTRHTSRFMIIWLSVLPLALWDDAGWVSVPITTIIAFLLLGIEEIGVAIEEPFALLPLRDIVRDIEKDLCAITASRKEVSGLLDLSLSLEAGESLSELIARTQDTLSSVNSSVWEAPGTVQADGSGVNAGRAAASTSSAVLAASVNGTSSSAATSSDDDDEGSVHSPTPSLNPLEAALARWTNSHSSSSPTEACSSLSDRRTSHNEDMSPSPMDIQERRREESLMDLMDAALSRGSPGDVPPPTAENVLFDSMEELPLPPVPARRGGNA